MTGFIPNVLFIDFDFGLTAGVTGRQGMLTPPWHLIPLLESQRSVFVHNSPDLYFTNGHYENWKFGIYDFCIVAF